MYGVMQNAGMNVPAVSRVTRGALVFMVLAAASFAVDGQAYRVRPLTPRPTPQLTLGGTISVIATPASVNFSLVRNGTAPGSSGVTITTTWDVIGLEPTLNLYGYFTSSTAALSDGRASPDLIPSSAVLGQMTTGVPTSYTPFTQTTPFGGGGSGLTLLNTVLPGVIEISGSRTDVLNLEINLAGVPSLPAGAYSGVLTIQATIN